MLDHLSKFFELNLDQKNQVRYNEMFEHVELQESINYMGIGILIAKQLLHQFDGNLDIRSSNQIGTELQCNMHLETI